jgi:hypothetical protein
LIIHFCGGRKERFGRGALRVPPKEEILDRFRLPLTAEDFEDVRATWKRLGTLSLPVTTRHINAAY